LHERRSKNHDIDPLQTHGIRLALALAGLAMPPAMAGTDAIDMKASPEVMKDFRTADTDRDGYLSGKEGMDYVGTSMRLDDLAFRAADIDGDGRLSPEEFARHAQSTRAPAMPAQPIYKRTPYSY
jgi:hypothetical protein